jgi:hypothetical protein
VLIALTLLLVGGLSVVAALRAVIQSEAALAEREATLREADRVLSALSLLGKGDLDGRLGRHPAGRFVAEVRRPEPTLYRLSLLASDTGTAELLVTVVHRPDEAIR